MHDKWPDLDDVLAAIGAVNEDLEPEVESCLAAAVDWVTHRSIDFGTGTLAIPDGVFRATIMLAARLFKRRESTDGVAGFGEFGAVRVTAVDPDVENLLAPYRRWGIA
jgi:hypothetical protein